MENVQRLEAVGIARVPGATDRVLSVRRWLSGWGPVLAVQALAILPLAGGVFGYMRHADAQAAGEAAEMQEHRVAIREVADGQKALRDELGSLTTAMESHSREEALYLKSLILRSDLDPRLAHTIAASTVRYCQLYGRDPNLVLAIISVESGFNPRAISPAGAVGLMQVMPHWKKVLGSDIDLTDPEQSIRAGLQILGFYQEMYGDLDMVLTAYNRGPGPVDGALRRGKPAENGYSQKVLATYEKLRRIDASSRP